MSSPGARATGRGVPKAATARPRARSTRCSPRATARSRIMPAFDPRLTPARADLAARGLEGKVEAARFVEGRAFEVIDPNTPVRGTPAPDASLLTEALKGEQVTVYDLNAEGWAWG